MYKLDRSRGQRRVTKECVEWTDADSWNDNVACLACFPDIVSEPLRATISVFLSEIGSTNLDFFGRDLNLNQVAAEL